MATVQSCALLRGGATASTDEVAVNHYQLRYIVTTNGSMAPADVAAGALSASPHPLPSLWSSYSYEGDTDAYSYARGYSVECDRDSTKIYYVIVSYRPLEPGDGVTDSAAADPINAQVNPLIRPPVFWWDREVYTQMHYRDNAGNMIRTKAFGYYEHDVELERTRGVLVAEMNLQTLAQVIDVSQKYDGAVNKTAWTVGGITIPARGALCREISSGPPVTEAGYRYYHVVFRFAMAGKFANGSQKTWDHEFPEYGRYYWKKVAGEYERDSNGFRKRFKVDDPVPLNDDGTERDPELPVLYTAWRVRPEEDFNLLPWY